MPYQPADIHTLPQQSADLASRRAATDARAGRKQDDESETHQILLSDQVTGQFEREDAPNVQDGCQSTDVAAITGQFPSRHTDLGILLDHTDATTFTERGSDASLETDSLHGLKAQGGGQPARRCTQNLGSAGLTLLVGLLPVYFIVFAVLARGNDSREILADTQAKWLLEAAKYGPTVFPIGFASIIGQFLTTIASWRLERRIKIGLLENFLASRSMGSAILSLVRLKTVNIWIPLILATWCFSPLGGQSSLRVVTSEVSYRQSLGEVQYLDVLMSQSPRLGGSSTTSIANLINAAFMAFLGSPPGTRNGARDMYGNLNIPMMQTLTGPTDENGWYNIAADMTTTKVSLVGVPVAGVPTGANSSFALETVYFAPNCTVASARWNNVTRPWIVGADIVTNRDIAGRSLVRPVYGYNRSSLRLIDSDAGHMVTSRSARKLGIQSIHFRDAPSVFSEAWCDLYMTYVEIRAYCTGGPSNCSAVAMRESRRTHWPVTATILEGVGYAGPSDVEHSSPDVARLAPPTSQASSFLAGLTTSVSPGGLTSDYTALEQYLVTPETPFSKAGLRGTVVPVAAIGSRSFSIRFAQLLNGYWAATAFADAVMGGFATQNQSDDKYAPRKTAHAQAEIMQIVLRYHHTWGAILVVTSVLLIVAGIATALLEALRSAPSVLDYFVSSLRHSPYAKLGQNHPMEDGDELVRRLQDKEVQIGEVTLCEEFGTVAVAIPTEKQPVGRLRKRRLYA